MNKLLSIWLCLIFCAVEISSQERGFCSSNYYTLYSFDRRFVTFSSGCSYLFSQSVGLAEDDPRYFKVVVERISLLENLDGFAFKSATVTFKNKNLAIEIKNDGSFKVNGEEMTEFDSDEVSIKSSVRNLLVETTFGVTVFTEFFRFQIILADSYAGKVDGVCGDFNKVADPYFIKQDFMHYQVGSCADDCEIGTDTCGANRICANLSGVAACQCAEGYWWMGIDCTKSCSREGQTCMAERGKCKMQNESLVCVCNQGVMIGYCYEFKECFINQTNAVTFDDQAYNLPQKCDFTLSKTTGLPVDNPSWYDITISRKNITSDPESSLAFDYIDVVLKGGDIKIRIINDGTSLVNGEKVLSYNSDGIELQTDIGKVELKTETGILLQTTSSDVKFSIMLNYKTRVDGVCGNFNDVADNDYTPEKIESFQVGECSHDECEIGDDSCGANAECSDIDGQLTCQCMEGYTGDGENCSDIDECMVKTGTSPCDANAICTNTPGSYTCSCNDGYTGNGKHCAEIEYPKITLSPTTTIAEDVNECETGNDCSVDATCTNTPGSYTCACNDGYIGNGKHCAEIEFERTTIAPLQPTQPPTPLNAKECTNGRVYCTCHACEVDCKDRENPPTCPPETCEDGCGCPHGTFVLDDACVPAEECPEIEACK